MTFDKDDMVTSVFNALCAAFDGQVDVGLGGDSVEFRDESGKLIGQVDVWNWAEKENDEG